eukprot:9321625-Pyramimonas_sp.AAC.1
MPPRLRRCLPQPRRRRLVRSCRAAAVSGATSPHSEAVSCAPARLRHVTGEDGHPPPSSGC